MFDIITHVALRCFVALTHPRPAAPQQRAARDSGQATTEYALVLLGAAARCLCCRYHMFFCSSSSCRLFVAGVQLKLPVAVAGFWLSVVAGQQTV